ncbi:MAG: HlyD family efflux transporter periplasmic adaptor subunit [Sandaracinaceae bacterium]
MASQAHGQHGGPYRASAVGEGLPLMRLVPPPVRTRRVATVLGAIFCALTVLAALAPWQQSASGNGRVIAFAPLERQQTIEAPVDGRVVRWHVQEGQHVEEGALLLELSDNDPQLFDRLEAERAITEERMRTYEARVTALEQRLEAVRGAQQSAVQAAQARLRVARDRLLAAEQSVQAAQADLDAQAVNLARSQVLAQQGLISQRDLELAVLAEARARTSRDASQAARDAARAERDAASASVEQAQATMLAEIENASATLQSARTDFQNAQTALLRIESRLARQGTQRITAPRDGVVFRIQANLMGEQVKAGDPLLTLVPDAADRAVELWIDGNDAALVHEGRPVRLQFEGWPAVQFAGWPSVAVGTFGGRVAFLDATDDGRGNFRIVVVPDPEDEPWPAERFLRQGVRANGWVLLDTVSLGFEIWRQLNGFPPTVTPHPSTSPARTSGYQGSRSPPGYGGGSGSSYGGGGGSSYGGGGGSSYGGGGGYGEGGGY